LLLDEGHYKVKVKVYDVVWKHEVVSTVTVVVKEIDDVAIANAGSLRIQGDFIVCFIVCIVFIYKPHPGVLNQCTD